jgi:hypothetical protein
MDVGSLSVEVADGGSLERLPFLKLLPTLVVPPVPV